MAKHRTKEEIAAEKLAKELARAERLAARQTKCASVYKLPCSGGCTRGCAKNVAARKASKSRSDRRKTMAARLEADIEKRTAARAAAEQARLDAVPAPKPKKGKFSTEQEKFAVEVLYLCGMGEREILVLIGREKQRGVYLGLVKRLGLAEKRAGSNVVQRLLDLDGKPPHGFAGFVDYWAARGRVPGLYAEIKRLREIVPALEVVKEIKRGEGETFYNPGASQLQRAAAGGAIADYNVAAGILLHKAFWSIPGGGVGAMRYTPDMVDNSAGDRDYRMVKGMDAAKTVAAGRTSVENAHKVNGTSAWRWAVIEHVVIHDEPLRTFAFPVGMTDAPARFLDEALLPLAIEFQTAPAGIGLRKATAEDRARTEFAEAMRRSRLQRLERDQPTFDPVDPTSVTALRAARG